MQTVQKETVTVNGAHLKKSCDINNTSHEVIKMLANRERLARFTDIVRTKSLMNEEGTPINDEDYLKFFQSLEKEGCGAIIYGRNTNRPRFEWYYNLKAIGKAALNGTNEDAELIEGVSKVKGKTYNRNNLKLVTSNTTTDTPTRRVRWASLKKPEAKQTPQTNIETDVLSLFDVLKNVSMEEIATIKSVLDRLKK